MKKDMVNAPYDPIWPKIFADLKSIITSKLGNLILEVEHVGSTAVPGLSAKPRIDLDIVVETMANLPETTQRLRELGYYPQGNLGRSGREAFGRNDDQVPYTKEQQIWMKHNLYICPKDSPVLKEHLLFRDYLRSHPETATEYAELKQFLVEQYRYDQAAYVAGKTAFIEQILRKTC